MGCRQQELELSPKREQIISKSQRKRLFSEPIPTRMAKGRKKYITERTVWKFRWILIPYPLAQIIMKK